MHAHLSLPSPLPLPWCELLLGGQKSGKSRQAERLAAQWLAASPQHQAVLLATADADTDDVDMQARIARHQQERAQRVPGLRTVELVSAASAVTAPAMSCVDACAAPMPAHPSHSPHPCAAASAGAHGASSAATVELTPSASDTALGMDLHTLIYTHSQPHTLLIVDCLTLWLTRLLMPWRGVAHTPQQALAAVDALCHVLPQCAGPVVLVGNEIGLGVIPLGREVRHFVDTLGLLNQRVAAISQRATLMAAGLPLMLKAPHHAAQ